MQVGPFEIDEAIQLGLIKELVSESRVLFSKKVYERIAENEFSLDDVADCIRSATKIHKAERDERRESADGLKYVIYGRASGVPFYTCGKLLLDGEDVRVYLVITAHVRTDHG